MHIVEQAVDDGQQLPIVSRPKIAPSAELGADLRQYALFGEEAVELDVSLAHRRDEIADDSLHQGPPDPRLGVKQSRCRSYRIQQIFGRKRIVEICLWRLAKEAADSVIERFELLFRRIDQSPRNSFQSGLLARVRVVHHS